MEYPDIKEAQSIIEGFSDKLKEEGRKEEAEELYHASHILWEHFRGPYNSPYDPEKFLEKHMMASAFDEWNEIAEIIGDTKKKMEWIGSESTREEFKDELNWGDFDRAERIVQRVDKKIKSDKHYTREAARNIKKAKEAQMIVKLFDDTIEEKWDEED